MFDNIIGQGLHALDIKESKHLTGNDILYLKENQISSDSVKFILIRMERNFKICLNS